MLALSIVAVSVVDCSLSHVVQPSMTFHSIAWCFLSVIISDISCKML